MRNSEPLAIRRLASTGGVGPELKPKLTIEQGIGRGVRRRVVGIRRDELTLDSVQLISGGKARNMVSHNGIVGHNIIGQRQLRYWEGLLSRIPVVKSIYNGVKQVSDTLFSSNGNAFRQALLIQYPRQGTWTIAFQTGTPSAEIAAHLNGEHLSVYVPTTPNPTGGYFIVVPKSDVRDLNMSVDQALTYIISMGAVVPDEQVAALSSPTSNRP